MCPQLPHRSPGSTTRGSACAVIVKYPAVRAEKQFFVIMFLLFYFVPSYCLVLSRIGIITWLQGKAIWLLIPSCQTIICQLLSWSTGTLYNLLPWHRLKDYRMPTVMAHYAASNSAQKDFLHCFWKLGEITVTLKSTALWDVAFCLIYSWKSNTFCSKHPVPKELKLQ